jgi:hypothetical protein
MSKSASRFRIVNAVTKFDRDFRPHERFFNQFSRKPTPALFGWGVGFFSRLTNGLTGRVALTICAALSVQMVPANAQEKLPTIPQIMVEVVGTEVFVEGAFGVGSRTPVSDFWLVLPDGTELPVTLDLDNPLGTRLHGCTYTPLHGGSPCAVKGYGYLRWDNATLQLVLTSIEDIAPPKELP